MTSRPVEALADLVRPALARVVEGDVGAEVPDGGHLGRAAREAGDERAGVRARPGRGARRGRRQRPARRRRRPPSAPRPRGRPSPSARCRSSRRRPRPGRRAGISCRRSTPVTAFSAYPCPAGPRCATTRRPSHSSPTPSPSALTRPATSRPGVSGSSGRRQRPGRLAAAQAGVEEVDAGGTDVDPHLPRPRLRVGHLLVAEVLRRAELVKSDRVHGRTVEVEAHFRSRTAGRPDRLGWYGETTTSTRWNSLRSE